MKTIIEEECPPRTWTEKTPEIASVRKSDKWMQTQ